MFTSSFRNWLFFGLAIFFLMLFANEQVVFGINTSGLARALRNAVTIEFIQGDQNTPIPGLRFWIKKRIFLDDEDAGYHYAWVTTRSLETNNNGQATTLLSSSYTTDSTTGPRQHSIYQVVVNPTDPGNIIEPCPSNPPSLNCLNYWHRHDRAFELNRAGNHSITEPYYFRVDEENDIYDNLM